MGTRSPRSPPGPAPGAACQVLADLGWDRSRPVPGRPSPTPTPTPGGVALPRGRSPATFFSRLGLLNPDPARTAISHDPLPPTVHSWELQGRALPASQSAMRAGPSPQLRLLHPPGFFLACRQPSGLPAWNLCSSFFQVPCCSCVGATQRGHLTPWSSGLHCSRR